MVRVDRHRWFCAVCAHTRTTTHRIDPHACLETAKPRACGLAGETAARPSARLQLQMMPKAQRRDGPGRDLDCRERPNTDDAPASAPTQNSWGVSR